MLMTDMRLQVTRMYPYDKWKKKVENMSDNRVLAIYLREQNKVTKTKMEELK